MQISTKQSTQKLTIIIFLYESAQTLANRMLNLSLLFFLYLYLCKANVIVLVKKKLNERS
jgi:hypothetical protein